MQLNQTLTDKLKNLPPNPGVYLMKDNTGKIIYIGKAKSLKSRVRSYFQSSKNHSMKVKRLVENIDDLDYIMTDSELEALILECNLIKQHYPKYNVKLKDDKSYPYIKITVNEKYPSIHFVRRIKKDKAKYFGPYTSAKSVRDTIDILKKIFGLKTCSKKRVDEPCLYYRIGQCKGFCTGNIDEVEYANAVKQAINFLNGKHNILIKEIENDMKAASANLEFERAGVLRDKYLALKHIIEGQKVVSSALEDQDVIAFARNLKGDSVADQVVIQIFFIRNGKLMGSNNFVISPIIQDDEVVYQENTEILEGFIKQFYSNTDSIPKEILLQEEIAETTIIESWLSEKRDNKVYIRTPKIGEKRRLIAMAEKNAMDALKLFIEKQRKEVNQTTGAIAELSSYLGLVNPPKRIEGFDISHIQGVETVASMVVFEDGKPKYSDYRRFKIQTVDGIDDFASMNEVLGRRFRRGYNEIEQLEKEGKNLEEGKFALLPNLVLIDGGKGQLSSARAAMKEVGADGIPTISIAKRLEEIFIEGRKQPLIIPKDCEAQKLLQRIRNESHRFAITYHRSLRGKNTIRTVLTDIPGIGKKRARLLLKEFGSVIKIKEASFEQIASIQGMNKKTAEEIIEYFHSTDF